MNSLKNWLYYFGLLLMFGVFLAEVYFLVPETTAYVMIVLATLALSRNTSMAVIPAALSTGLLLTGFALGAHNQEASVSTNYANDLIGLATIWISVAFTIRYRRSIANERWQREMVNSLFLSANESITIVNSSGHITMANPAACKLFDYSIDELIGQKIEILIPDHLQLHHEEMRSEYMKDPAPRSLTSGAELYGKRSDGKLIPVDISLSPFELDKERFVVAFVLDISARKQTEQELRLLNAELEDRVAERTRQVRESLRELEEVNESLANEVQLKRQSERQVESSQRLNAAIASNFPDGWIGILDDEFRYIFASGRGIKGLQIYPSDLVGKGFADLAQDPGVVTLLKQSVNNNETRTFEMMCYDHICEVTVQPFSVENTSNAVLVVVHDITKQKKRQESLIAALEKEKELGQLKSRFVTIASHEFRTPLTTILSSAYLLHNYAGDQLEKMKFLHVQRIKRAATLLTEILDDFLSLNKFEEGIMSTSFSEIELVEYMSEFVDEMTQHKRPGQSLTFNHHGNSVIRSDKKILYNILSNLVNNAIKYAGDEGSIVINLVSTDDSLVVSVTDNGIGIPREDQKHLFERFFRANNVSHIQGTGLGLNITKKYVQLLKGTITFESSPGIGSTFVVRFPNSN